MDIGDTIIYGGKHYRVSGFDPAGVEPRMLYLEDPETGESLSILLRQARNPPRYRELHLVDPADGDEKA
jgi:hypothetical protein